MQEASPQYSGLSAEQLWEIYVPLSRAEDGFAALKGDLGLLPNYHQPEQEDYGDRKNLGGFAAPKMERAHLTF